MPVPQSQGRSQPMIGPLQLILLLLVILLLFYSNRLPNLMRDLGKGIANFKRERRDDDRSDKPD
jgi:TatA/E family protein of Tat protein translocase